MILTNSSETYSDDEKQRLRQTLASAPGVSRVGDITRHPKGGYVASFDCDRQSIDDFLLHIQAAGYSGVL